MKRREFLWVLGSTATWPLAARGEQATMPTIEFLGGGSLGQSTDRLRAFRQGLAETDCVEGRNVAIEYRWTEDQNDRLPALTADLLSRQVAVIAASTTPAALAAKTATTAVPIAFVTAANPVTLGLVASLNRPGANVTGVT